MTERKYFIINGRKYKYWNKRNKSKKEQIIINKKYKFNFSSKKKKRKNKTKKKKRSVNPENEVRQISRAMPLKQKIIIPFKQKNLYSRKWGLLHMNFFSELIYTHYSLFWILLFISHFYFKYYYAKIGQIIFNLFY